MPIALESREALLERLRSFVTVNGLYKDAATIGGDPSEEFEQTFATLALNYIQDKAPALMDHLVGFQLVDRTPDNAKAIGTFGFRVGNQQILVPSFFLNGKIKGHEAMYLQNQDLVLPLKENWVNYVLGKKPHVLGRPVSGNLQSMGVRSPDVRSLSTPPNMDGKRASVNIPDHIADWFIPFLPGVGRLAAGGIPPQHETETLSFWMKRSFPICRAVNQAFQMYPALEKISEKLHGRNILIEALQYWADQVEKAAKAPVKRPRLDLGLGHSPFLTGDWSKRAAEESVAILVEPEADDLSEQEKEKMLSQGYVVRDRREGERTSLRVEKDEELQLQNPTESGLYEVLTAPGEYKELLVLFGPQNGKQRQKFVTVVDPSTPRGWINVDPVYVWAKPSTKTRTDIDDAFEDLGGVSDLAVGGYYLAVHSTKQGNLEGSVPFRIRRKLTDGRYEVSFEDYCSRRFGRQSLGEYDGPYDELLGPEAEPAIYINDRDGTSMKAVNGILAMPKDCKVITLKKPPKPDQDDDGPMVCCGPSYLGESDDPPLSLSSLEELELDHLQKTAELKLYVDGVDASINNGPQISKRSALFELISRYGFREQEAKTMLKEATVKGLNHSARLFRVKYAFGYPMTQPVYGPENFPEQEFNYDNIMGSSVPMTEEQVDVSQVPGLESAMSDTSGYDLQQPDPQAMQQAYNGGQKGQKEVFDTSMFKGMLKSTGPDAISDDDLPQYIKTVDKLGRRLLSYYWHNDDYAERYGKADLPELEDSFRNNFDSMGDLSLYVKEKDVGPFPDTDFGEPSVEGATGD